MADPLRRDPAIQIRHSTEPRRWRNRIHLDVVRPAAAVEQADLDEASGPFGVCHTDPDDPRTGATADPQLPRFVQLFLDAADVAAVRAFWVAAPGDTDDRATGVNDIQDRQRLDPVLVFQELDASETERCRQRNRIHVELAAPSELTKTR